MRKMKKWLAMPLAAIALTSMPVNAIPPARSVTPNADWIAIGDLEVINVANINPINGNNMVFNGHFAIVSAINAIEIALDTRIRHRGEGVEHDEPEYIAANYFGKAEAAKLNTLREACTRLRAILEAIGNDRRNNEVLVQYLDGENISNVGNFLNDYLEALKNATKGYGADVGNPADIESGIDFTSGDMAGSAHFIKAIKSMGIALVPCQAWREGEDFKYEFDALKAAIVNFIQ